MSTRVEQPRQVSHLTSSRISRSTTSSSGLRQSGTSSFELTKPSSNRFILLLGSIRVSLALPLLRINLYPQSHRDLREVEIKAVAAVFVSAHGERASPQSK